MKRLLLFSVVVLLTASGLFAQLQFQPASVDFGQKPVTSASTLEVILTSQINQLISLSDLPAPFSASPDEFMISIGEQKTVTITFHPMTVGSFAQTLTASGGVWGTAQLQLSGEALPASVAFDVQSLDMGNILMTGHSEQMITVESDIAQQVTLENLDLPFAANPQVIDLDPGTPAQVFVSFDPTLPGYFADYLTATGSISGYAETYISGSATEASIFAFPQSLNFEPLFSGEADTLEIMVSTDINQAISLTGLSDAFSVSPENLTMIAGEAQTVYVGFAPVNPGNFSQTLVLTGSLWGNANVPVYGQCIDPQISVSTAGVDFGTIALLSSYTLNLPVTNTGNGTLECTVANSNPHFTFSPEALSISQGSSQDVAITFVPDFVPAEYDTLLITSNDPDTPLVKIPMTGQGMSQVSGEVCGTWYKANSPYNFAGSVTVPESCTLTIEPGVVVNMGDYNFFVNGKLVCNGLVNDSIYLNGTGIFQLSTSCPNDSIDYVAIDGGSNGSDGLTIRCFGGKMKNTRIKAYKIENGKSIFYDNFENGTWEDNWNILNTNGYANVSPSYGYSGNGLRVYSNGYYNGDHYIFTNPITLNTSGTISISLWFKIPSKNYQNNTQFFYRINFGAGNYGNWNMFYETNYNTVYDWTLLQYSINSYFQPSDVIEIMVMNNCNNSSNYQITYIDEVKILNEEIYHGFQFLNSQLDIYSFDNYAKNSDALPSFLLDNSKIKLVENFESHPSHSSINICNSIVDQAGNYAIRTNGINSNVLLNNVSIENSGINVISTYADSANVIMVNSMINNCTGKGIYTHSSYSSVTVSNSTISNNGSDGIFINGSGSPLNLENSEIINNHGNGINSLCYSSTNVINQSTISGNFSNGIKLSGHTLIIKGSIVSKNHGEGISANNVDISNSTVNSNMSYGIFALNIYGNYLSSIYNGNKGIYASNSEEISYLFNSIVCLNSQYGSQFSGNFDFAYSKVSGDPKLADSLGHLLPNSPCIDAADPTEEDARIPFGMGTVRADMGAYGGPENWVWGGEPIPANGEPEIVHIVDIPQDQGKKVGIQFSASLFDNGHTAYDVTHYSFWRELDENGKLPLEASKAPVGQFFQKGPNYWEYVGEMPANGFANYGYSATTLADSTVSGMFWSKFLVVAHTNDNDTYWVSQPDSGYSVDNLAPATPLNLAGTVAGVTYNLAWNPSPDEDLQYYAVYKAENGLFGEAPFATTTEPEFSGIVLSAEMQDFAVAAFDFSGNRSPLSSPVAAPVYDLLTIPAGWSGISSWIEPSQPELGYLFAPASTGLIILQNMQGVYWPGQNVNTLGQWNENEGYMVKMAGEAQIPFIGTKNLENHFQLTSGWQILPVLSNCPLTMEELQNQLGSNLVMVKEIAGWRVFWPEMGISTLETLEPGKAYFLKTVTGNGQVMFGECE